MAASPPVALSRDRDTEAEMRKCCLCKGTAQCVLNAINQVWNIQCPRCGTFDVSDEFAVGPISYINEDRLRALSSYVRQENLNRQTPLLKQSTWQSQSAGHYERTIPQKLRKLLEFVANESKHVGAKVLLRTKCDFLVADAENDDEFGALIEYLQSQGLLSASWNGADSAGTEVVLKIPGWEAAYPQSTGKGVPGTCFVAMQYSSELNEAYHKGIKPAIESCALDPIRLDQRDDVDLIDDALVAELRRAQFVVADVTGQSQNVYFEAGFALGLGRTVIWTCQQTHLGDVKFNVQHYSLIPWDSPEDLYDKLRARLRARIPNERLAGIASGS